MTGPVLTLELCCQHISERHPGFIQMLAEAFDVTPHKLQCEIADGRIEVAEALGRLSDLAVRQRRPTFVLFRKHSSSPQVFGVDDAPDWLTSCHTVPGSTMDHRWFWEHHIQRLQPGDWAHADFCTIVRAK